MFSVGEWLPLVWTLWHFHFADLFYVRKNATWHSKGKAKVQKAQYDLFEACCIHLKPPRCLVCCTEPSGEAPLETEKEKAFLNKSRQVIALIIRLSPCIVSLFQPVTSIVGQTFHQRSQFINPSLKVNSPVVMNQSVVSNHCVLSHKRISLKPEAWQDGFAQSRDPANPAASWSEVAEDVWKLPPCVRSPLIL